MSVADQHRIHVPVMGTGFSIDSPIRVGRFGIASVISLVDDLLLERIRGHYSRQMGLPFTPIGNAHPDKRAARITAYLDLMQDMLDAQMEAMKALPWAAGNEKTRYFEMLPESAPAKAIFREWEKASAGPKKNELEAALTAHLRPGAIDGNIMTKLDRNPFAGKAAEGSREAVAESGHLAVEKLSDAQAALRGFAQSKCRGSLVLSAGVNPTLFGYLEDFPQFYRTLEGPPAKGLILKVSDFRSSMTQGRFLARKGIEVREFRIESGLNCGGHAFATDGFLLGPVLQEFREQRGKFSQMFEPMIEAYYRKKGREFPPSGKDRPIRVTAQGGIGHPAEIRRLLEGYGLDGVGIGSPFLLVAEATCLDAETRKQLAEAGEDDIYLSDASPLGIPFQNLRNSGAERFIDERIESGKPGSPCPKGHLRLNHEFGGDLCTASQEYQKTKLANLGFEAAPKGDCETPAVRALYKKQCICDQLGNGALKELGIAKGNIPVAVCPGPNLAYFNRTYSLAELLAYFHGTGTPLVPESRPHFFAKELGLYLEYYANRVLSLPCETANQWEYRREFLKNLRQGLAHYDLLGATGGYPDEAMDSLAKAVAEACRKLDGWEAQLKQLAETLALAPTP